MSINEWKNKIDEIINYITLYEPKCEEYEECEKIITKLFHILRSFIKDPNKMTEKLYDKNAFFTKNSYDYLQKELYDNLLVNYIIILDDNDLENPLYISYVYESIYIIEQLFEYKKDNCLNKHINSLNIKEDKDKINEWANKVNSLLDLYKLYEPDCSSFDECLKEINRVNLIIILFIVKGLDYTDSTNIKYKLTENDLKDIKYLDLVKSFKDYFWMLRLEKKQQYIERFSGIILNTEKKKQFITDYFNYLSEPKQISPKQFITDYFKPVSRSRLSQTKITDYYKYKSTQKPRTLSTLLKTSNKGKIPSYFEPKSR